MPQRHELRDTYLDSNRFAADEIASHAPGQSDMANDAFSSIVPISLLGVSHHTASLRIRGKLGFSGSTLEKVLTRFQDSGFDECMVLATCNRTEIYFVGGCREEAERILVEESGLPFAELTPVLYTMQGISAVKHLFKVFSGLDSAVVGETEILAQIKEAVTTARRLHAIGRNLDFAIRKAHSASRRVRSSTELCRNVTSIASLAVRDAANFTGGLTGKTVLILGAGKIAERIAKELASHQPLRLIFINRTEANAETLAQRYDGHVRPISELYYSMAEAHAMFAATSTEIPIVDAAELACLNVVRQSQPLAIVDLGVPPNIDPMAAMLPAFNLLDMDDLISKCSANSERRIAAVPVAFEMLDEELAQYVEECEQKAASPSIEVMVRYADDVRNLNLRWAKEKLGHLSDQDLKIVSDLANRMVRGFLQSPIRELKEEHANPQSRELVTKLFRSNLGGSSDRES